MHSCMGVFVLKVFCNQAKMASWKSSLIEAYRVASWPYRRWRHLQRCRGGSLPVYSLFYHRVADTNLNPWTITHDDFQRQIDWFQENFEIVDLRESQRRIKSGFNDRPTLSITFDDGYSENCDFALPMLIERRIPVTYFVTTFHTVQQQAFPHDVERGAPLPVNTVASLRALDQAGIEIGAHTRTHPDLGRVTCPVQLADEVITSAREMEKLIGRKIEYFAFPYGQVCNLNPEVFEMLRKAGFLGVCSAYGGWNEIGGNEFHIQRIHGDPDFARIKNWLTYDPRIKTVERYDYVSELKKLRSEGKPVELSGSGAKPDLNDAGTPESNSQTATGSSFPELYVAPSNPPNQQRSH